MLFKVIAIISLILSVTALAVALQGKRVRNTPSINYKLLDEIERYKG